METIAGLRTTGRRVGGPTADLVEVSLDDGSRQTALVFHPEYRDPRRLLASQTSLSFLAEPKTEGIAPLLQHRPEEGVFVYGTGRCWSMAEVVRIFSDRGASAGVRAGLELCYLVGQALVDAAEAASPHGLYAHGSLDPRRIVFGPQGAPSVLGYGLIAVDFLEQRDGRRPRDEDTVRYVAPECFDGAEPDLGSDLFTLALLGVELSLGRPVYDGLVEDIRRQAGRGEAHRRLYRWRDAFPEAVLEVYAQALKPDHDARFRNGVEYVYAFHDLLGSIDAEGPSLAEVMARFRNEIRQGGAFQGGVTGALTRAELAELAADLQSDDTPPLPPPRRPRPVQEVEPVEPTDARWVALQTPPPEPASARDRLKQRLRSRDEAPSPRERLQASLRARQPSAAAAGRPRRLGEGTRSPDPVRAEASAAPAHAPPTPPPAMAAPPPPVEPPPPAMAAPPPVAPPPAVAPLPPVEPRPVEVPPAPHGLVRLRVRAPGRVEDLDLPGSLTLGEAAVLVAHRLGLPTVDALGQSTAWPVLTPDDLRVPHGTTVADLPPDGTVQLGLVPARTCRLELRVEVEPPLRCVVPLAVHLPVRHLCASLCAWLGLDEGPWTLVFGQTALHPDQLLAELSPTDGAILRMRR